MTETERIQNIIDKVLELGHEPSTKELRKILSKSSKPEGGFYSKAEIIQKYTTMVGNSYTSTGDTLSLSKCSVTDDFSLQTVRRLLRTKPTRTISGVAPITIFTKPYDCPGNCIFCPTQTDMPKSYLREEPGAMRAESLKFNPYEQTKVRIQALDNIGHNTEKVDIIISGGTWTFYPKDYREWYIEEVFRALNGAKTKKFTPLLKGKELSNEQTEEQRKTLHKQNETAKHRCVGLTIETRPDYINKEEILHLRKLGVTKVQLGVQSLNDRVLELNKRGHTADDSRRATNLLRLAGFKIHIHWMANLHGSTLEKDYVDFQQLFRDPSVMPDELKIYPCSVIDDTKLKDLMDAGEFIPYEEKALVDLLAKCKTKVPQYCRITRLFRDIPSPLIKGRYNKNKSSANYPSQNETPA